MTSAETGTEAERLLGIPEPFGTALVQQALRTLLNCDLRR